MVLIPLLVIVSVLLVISLVYDLFKKEEDEEEIESKKKIYNEANIKREIDIDFTKDE